MRFTYNKRGIFFFVLLFSAITMFVVFNYLVGGGMFVNEMDGFYSQMSSVSNGVNLGSLGFLHEVRYYLVFPYYYFSGFSLVQGLILSAYISPIFIIGGPPFKLKIIALSIFILPFFFSYRTIITMIYIYIMILCILWPPQPVKYILFSFLYASLSTGSFFGLILIFVFFRNRFLTTAWKKMAVYTFASVSALMFLGSVVHKILFFIDPSEFASSAGVNINSVLAFDDFSMSKLIIGIFERGLLYVSYTENNLRFGIVLFFWALSFFFLVMERSKLSLSIFVAYSFGCFVEGLMAFSFIFTIFVLFVYYFLMRLNRLVSKGASVPSR